MMNIMCLKMNLPQFALFNTSQSGNNKGALISAFFNN